MSQGPAINKTTIQGVVSDGMPDSMIEGSLQSVSITKQGRVRVATVSEDTGVAFFVSAHEAQWGESPSFTPGSPWETW